MLYNLDAYRCKISNNSKRHREHLGQFSVRGSTLLLALIDYDFTNTLYSRNRKCRPLKTFSQALDVV
jgi:hypothetical protein